MTTNKTTTKHLEPNCMNIKEITRAILDADIPDFYLSRTFLNCEPSYLFAKRMNELIDKNPDMQDIIVAFSIMPALKWLLKSKSINLVVENVTTGNHEIDQLKNIQYIITEASGVETKLFLENRQRYFAACEELVRVLEQTIEFIGMYPVHGEIYQSILNVFAGETDNDVPSNYIIKKYIDDMFEIVYEEAGEKIEAALEEVLSVHYTAEDPELAHLFHNVKVLLEEYSRICWKAQYSDDKAIRLLQCRTAEEMLAITESDEKYRQAYTVVEFIKFINGAIEQLQTFPLNGDDYYRIIKSIVEIKTRKVSDAEIAKSLDMSTYSYSVKRRRAFLVLGSILWGCDGDAFIKLLMDGKDTHGEE